MSNLPFLRAAQGWGEKGGSAAVWGELPGDMLTLSLFVCQMASTLSQVYQKGLIAYSINGQNMVYMNSHAFSGHVTRSPRSIRSTLEFLYSRGWRVPTPDEEALIRHSIATNHAILSRRGSHAITSSTRASAIGGSRFVINKAKIYTIPL